MTKKRSKVECIVVNNDTLIQMNLSDAKLVFRYLLDGEVADSLLNSYMEKDKINTEIITVQKSTIDVLQQKCKNKDLLIDNLKTLIDNKETEIVYLNNIIKEQKKEIRKQKIIKVIALAGDVVLPVITVLLILGL